MLKGQLGDCTINEMFENAFGKERAAEILAEIQHAYDSGARGVDLMSRADAAVARHNITTKDTTDDIVNLGATATSVGAFAVVAVA